MIAATGNTTMLYCPKCRRTYEDGTQRFCDNDGGRLLPAPVGQTGDSAPGGVFTNLLGKTGSTGDADKKINAAPRFIPLSKTEESDKKMTSFPSVGRIFQSEQFLKPDAEDLSETEDSILELDPLPSEKENETILEFEPFTKNVEETEPIEAEKAVSTEIEEESHEVQEESQKPLPRLIKPSEIASGTADVGNRQTNPLGRDALSWENTNALLGQTVKGRYLVLEELEADDEDSLIYLAEDQIFEGKKTVVRVFMNDDYGADDLEEKIFAEERVSLSHLNHPNIAGVLDSGELPEGNEFIVSEFVEGKSLAEMLRQTGQFNSLRTARIIRQISYALSEAHQNGILHRNLRPENISLTVSEAGIEQVKLMSFGMAHSEITDANIAYKAPEEIERGTTNFASDIYSLAVIAYQMLTAHFPFTTATDNALLKAQKAGLSVLPTTLRLDIQPLTDKILAKALAFNPAERYPKARDFGDAFFNALTTVAPWAKEVEEPEVELLEVDETQKEREFYVVPSIDQKNVSVEESPLAADIHITPKDENSNTEIAEVKATEALAWEKRSPELPQTGTSWRGLAAIAGVVALLLLFWGVSRLFLNRSNQPEANQNQVTTAVVPSEKTPDNALTSGEADIAPQQRLQKTPQNFQRFQNDRENLSENLAKNFLGFEVFYPQDWTKNKTETNFLDVSKSDSSGFPIEQMIVTRYESRGTMTLDKPNFPKLVAKSNDDLKKSLGESFKFVSEGDAVVQNGRWKVYEVKFQSSGVNSKGEKVTVWGKRLWLPVQRAGVQNGFVITLLATSLSDTVKSVDDVGTQGELAKVLETFEPEQF